MSDIRDTRALRDAFGCFATGVTIVTGMDTDGTPVGFTANSFTSVSLDPPLLLVCPGRTASSLPAIRRTGRFGVSVLSVDQQAVAERFAKRGVDRFGEGQWVESESGLKLLEGACANFDCTLVNDIEAGDHQLLIGRIDSFRSSADRVPLMYLRGRYALAPAAGGAG
jgi:flavin reductase (DIM6/NTAB) family NADH-FMN oxidoreductase RutF